MAGLNPSSEGPLVSMKHEDNMCVMTRRSREARDDVIPLARLGAELAQIFGDTLNARLPSNLQALVDRLDDALGSTSSGCGHRPQSR